MIPTRTLLAICFQKLIIYFLASMIPYIIRGTSRSHLHLTNIRPVTSQRQAMFLPVLDVKPAQTFYLYSYSNGYSIMSKTDGKVLRIRQRVLFPNDFQCIFGNPNVDEVDDKDRWRIIQKDGRITITSMFNGHFLSIEEKFGWKRAVIKEEAGEDSYFDVTPI